MKLTWNKNPKKRSRVALSNFPDLPFEKDDAPESQSHRQFREDDIDRRQTTDQLDSSDHPREKFDLEAKDLAESIRAQGDKLAEEGKYQEALGKWEAALNLVPEDAVLHEQKAQVLLELGDAWKALKAATRNALSLSVLLLLYMYNLEYYEHFLWFSFITGATEIDPSWAEAWTTLGRAQLNFGEPDSAIRSFESALLINADSREAKDDLKTAKQLIKKREQLQTSGQDTDTKRFVVGDKNIEPN
ncbi:Tetratricopeptide repeat-containing domain [Arabidopsis thaliana x Arabidopsis arenosa]|uniref:Tetratricopeptide repeat-containing domain n=1 Tax=Arabidopsis thaliana x Arabidopsis arenosa TaxID=1240361 RepID=A0A8T2BNI8_9BRAS|nr:Tetratricopeptide repeat-containing domain [Arabidopsis thaliana x Arabidopsis arenosa]